MYFKISISRSRGPLVLTVMWKLKTIIYSSINLQNIFTENKITAWDPFKKKILQIATPKIMTFPQLNL